MKKLFIFSEISIYLLFIIFDFLKINSTYIKYLGIILCFLYTLYDHKPFKSIAMFFTLLADLFLLVLNNHYLIGVSSFIIVQFIYFSYMSINHKVTFKPFLLVRIALLFIEILILILTDIFSLLNLLTIFYFLNLVVNLIQSSVIKNKVLTVGLALFVCCDICVGLHNILPTTTIASFLMWVFYLPSQVLIVLS